MSVRRFMLGVFCAAGLVLMSTVGCSGGAKPASTPPASSATPEASTPAETPAEETPAAAPAETPAPEKPAETPAPETSASTPAATTPETPAPQSSGPVEEGWGHLSGRFVYDGTAPKQAEIKVTKDIPFCTKMNPLDESLVVNSANNGIQNVCVYLYLGRSGKAPEPHPSYAETAKANVRLDNLWCRFQPHVQTLRTSQTLIIGNKDEVGHNTKCDLLNNPPFNVTIPVGQDVPETVGKAERLPAGVACNIHPWMSGHLIVQDHPYMAVSDHDGNFQIKNLPAGKWTFQVWQEKSGYVDKVSVGGKPTEWKRGRVELTINSGDNNLGEIKIEPALFEK